MQYFERLKRDGLNLIILKNNEPLYQSAREGMLPLYQAINELGIAKLENSIIIDKIVGKAAALLAGYIQAQAIFCSLLSLRGKTSLEKQGISYCYEELTPEIINRYGTDICPFEKAVLHIDDPETGYQQIRATLHDLGLLHQNL